MIIGMGVDLVDIRRIEDLLKKYGDRFVKKIFTPQEQEYATRSPYPAHVYANRFAAKEAAVKALRTGLRGGIEWKHMEVLRAPSGAPSLCFHGKAQEKLLSLLPKGSKSLIHVSFSDEPPYSTACVIISCVPEVEAPF